MYLYSKKFEQRATNHKQRTIVLSLSDFKSATSKKIIPRNNSWGLKFNSFF